MKITGLTICPDFGYFGDQLIKGNQHLMHFQYDVVKTYMLPFVDSLEENYVMTNLIRAHVKPSLQLDARKKLAKKNQPAIFLGCDWMEGNSSQNISRVYYSAKPCHKLASVICEGLEDWGHRYVHGHRVANPIMDSNIGEGNAIRISPFMLNGPNADEYLQRLQELGETLGVSIMLYLNEVKMGRIRYA